MIRLLTVSFPLEDPVLIFTVVISIVLLAPILLKKINIPDIIGLILAGVIVGPYGFNILSQDIGLSIFGTIGLLYLMFLAGLEIDFNDFIKNRKQGSVFGVLTFLIPFILGMIFFYFVLEFKFRSAILVSIMLSSHTLVAYPILGRFGITNHRIATIAIAGTIIADTAVLIILGLVSDSVQGDLSLFFWIRTIIYFGIFFIYIIYILPAVARWFFRYLESENSIQYVFVLATIFVSASLAEMLKIEPLIGAFFSGLTLNRLIIKTSPLMNRIVFIGNTIFIPFFIISIGMLVDFSTLFKEPRSLLILFLLIAIAVSGKFTAAFIAQRVFGYTVQERKLLLGLSSARAASAIAIVLVGNNFDLISDVVLNDTVILILITSLFSSYITQNAGKKLASTVSVDDEVDEDNIPERILIPIRNPATIEKLIEFSMVLKDLKSKEPLYPISVVSDNKEAAQTNAGNRKILQKALVHASSSDHKIELISRIDLNIVDGITRAVKELDITKIIIGWHGRYTTLDRLFGTLLDKLTLKNNQMIVVSRIRTPISLFEKVYVVLPEKTELETGFTDLVRTLKNISVNLKKELFIYSEAMTIDAVQKELLKYKKSVAINCEDSSIDYGFFKNLSSNIRSNDFLIIVSSRKNTTTYTKLFDQYPRIINTYFKENNFAMIFPEQLVFPRGLYNVYNLTSTGQQ